jgi:hypothetical protein
VKIRSAINFAPLKTKAFKASFPKQLRTGYDDNVLIYIALNADLKSPARKGVPVRFRVRAP